MTVEGHTGGGGGGASAAGGYAQAAATVVNSVIGAAVTSSEGAANRELALEQVRTASTRCRHGTVGGRRWQPSPRGAGSKCAARPTASRSAAGSRWSDSRQYKPESTNTLRLGGFCYSTFELFPPG